MTHILLRSDQPRMSLHGAFDLSKPEPLRLFRNTREIEAIVFISMLPDVHGEDPVQHYASRKRQVCTHVATGNSCAPVKACDRSASKRGFCSSTVTIMPLLTSLPSASRAVCRPVAEVVTMLITSHILDIAGEGSNAIRPTNFPLEHG